MEQISQSTGVPGYLYTDQLGSVVTEADQSGNITATQSYSPYGTVSSHVGDFIIVTANFFASGLLTAKGITALGLSHLGAPISFGVSSGEGWLTFQAQSDFNKTLKTDISIGLDG